MQNICFQKLRFLPLLDVHTFSPLPSPLPRAVETQLGQTLQSASQVQSLHLQVEVDRRGDPVCPREEVSPSLEFRAVRLGNPGHTWTGDLPVNSANVMQKRLVIKQEINLVCQPCFNLLSESVGCTEKSLSVVMSLSIPPRTRDCCPESVRTPQLPTS